jgi:hypothetical protein
LLHFSRYWRGGLAAIAVLATIGAAQGAQCQGESTDLAVSHAQEIVRILYGTPAFADARNDIDDTVIRQLDPYLTDRLVAALQAYAAAVSKSTASTDTLTKPPYREGPVFHSNYEGMDKFSLGGATATADRTIHVNVDMNFDSSMGNAAWTDVAVLLCEGDGWRLDDIVFDPKQNAGPSLGQRIAVR